MNHTFFFVSVGIQIHKTQRSKSERVLSKTLVEAPDVKTLDTFFPLIQIFLFFLDWGVS